MPEEPVTPYRTFNNSQRSTPLSSASTQRSSKWAKFQEKLYQYSKSSQASPANISLRASPLQQPRNIGTRHIHSERCHPSSSVPLRSTSIPKTAFDYSNVPKSSSTPTPSPPKVKPFLYSKSATPPRNKRTLMKDKCCFCGELLSNKLYSLNEKVIELECGDSCHEECLSLLLNPNSLVDDKTASNLNTLFPVCEICGKTAMPSDQSITDSIISKALLSSTPPKLNSLTSSNSSNSLILSPEFQTCNGQSTSPMLSVSSSNNGDNELLKKYTSLSLSNKNQKDLSIEIPSSRSRSLPRPSYVHHHKSSSRGSSISAISSIITSVTRSPSPTNDSFMSPSNNNIIDAKVPLKFLRSEYTKDLLDHNFDLTAKNIESFGELRLVDKLLISTNGEIFTEQIGYLFQYNLLVSSPNYSTYDLFNLLDIPKVQTPASSILKISLNKGEKSLYISQKSNKILQKWIAGFCDYDFIFNADNLSSTVQLDIKTSRYDDIESQDVKAQDGKRTLHVLLSPIKLDDSTPVSTPSSLKTTVEQESFFQKVENLIFIIDHSKPLFEKTINILQNIVKVLNSKFKQFKVICAKDNLSKVYAHGSSENILSKIGQFDVIESQMSVHKLVNDYVNGDKEKFGSLIISDSIDVKDLKDFPLLNRLIMKVSSHNGKLISKPNFVKTDSWDNIMEIIISKYKITFDDESDVTYSDSDDTFDSDLDSDFANESNSAIEFSLQNKSNKLRENNKNAWNKLFEDLDNAILETTKSISDED